MRLVLDTSVVASGLLWEGGPPAHLLDAARMRTVEVFTSPALLAELARIPARDKFARFVDASGLSIDELVLGFAALASVIEPASISPVVAEDPGDNQVLACALAAQADLIVSGDHHLLNIKDYHRIDIVEPAEAVRRSALA